MKCQGLKRICTSEFNCRKFLFGYAHYKQLILPRWPIKPWIYVIYRFIVFIYTWFLLIWRCVANNNFYTFLTIWGYFTIVINFTVKFSAVVIYYSWLQHEDESEAESSTNSRNNVSPVTSAPLLLKLSWLCTNVSSNISFLVTIVYWLFLYSTEIGPPDHFNVQLHVVNSILVLVDIIIIHIPFNLLHFYQPILFAVLYVILNVSLWATKGTIVYKILNWNRPSKTLITIFGVIIFLIVLHSFLFLITKALNQCKSCTKSKRNNYNLHPDEIMVETIIK